MKRALVVDDNVKIVEVLSAYLREEGFDVAAAFDGPSAVAAARDTRPDIVLLDVMLPGMGGIDVLRELQREHDIPVILVTARAEEVDRLVGLEVGADDYVTKPFSPREVVARVKAVLRRAERGADRQVTEAFEVGDVRIDPERRAVTVEGRDVVLTRTEFDMLVSLAAHPGRVYSRLQLLEIASGEAFEGYERTIDAHVKNLRRKLGDDPKAPRFIGTVIGVGYRFEAR